MSAGSKVGNPGGLLSRTGLASAIEVWRERFDRVLLMTPPVTEANDATVIGHEADGAIMVVKLGETPRRLTERAIDSLASTGVRLLGCVLTNSDRAEEGMPKETLHL